MTGWKRACRGCCKTRNLASRKRCYKRLSGKKNRRVGRMLDTVRLPLDGRLLS